MGVRIKTILLFICAYFYSLLSKKGKRVLENPPKTIVIAQTTSNIGDMLFTTPMFSAIRSTYPECKIVLLCSKKNKSFLEGDPNVDKFILISDGVFSVVNQLRKIRPDFGCVLHPSSNNLSQLILAGIPCVSTFSFPQKSLFPTRIYTYLKKRVITVDFSFGNNFSLEYLKLLQPVGISSKDTRKHLTLSKGDREWAKGHIKKHNLPKGVPLIAITPGSGGEAKVWPVDYFRKLSQELINKYNAGIIVAGGVDDRNAMERIKKGVNKKNHIINGCGESLGRLKALLAEVDFIIGNDTGPVYIVEAFGGGTLVLVGPTDEREHPLQDKIHGVVLPTPRGGVYPSFGLKGFPDLEGAKQQMKSITVDVVFQEAKEILSNLGFLEKI